MWSAIGQLGSGLLGQIASLVNTKQINKTNLQIARETNQANREMVEMQNQAAKEEAEKAYKRSSAPNQVAQMMSAGMSRAGAITALNGGGSYTPAPVNVSQDSAPQMETTDFSALANIGQALGEMAQRKHDEKMQAKQITAQKEMQKEQLESQERIARENNRVSREAMEYQFISNYMQLQHSKDDLQLRREQFEYGKKLVDAQVDLTNAQKDDIKAKLDDFKSKPARNAREAQYQLQQMSALYNYRVSQNDFYEFLKDNFVKGEDGEYYPLAKMSLDSLDQGAVGIMRNMSETAHEFWTMIFSIIPVKPLLECIKLFGS